VCADWGAVRRPMDRAPASACGTGTTYKAQAERGAKKMEVAADGPIIFDDRGMRVDAALAGLGIEYVLEDRATEHFNSGSVVRLLQD